ncbi:MAG: RNA methyltransferase [Cyclobacteriaceae bacterium]|nr:RNA methyltransferase [Cyclobacteriaceae bacterium]
MLSKSKISFIKSLQVKKYRQAEQCFLIQGAKTVNETLTSDFEILTLLGTQEFLSSVDDTILGKVKEIIRVSETELTTVGSVETNNSALAVVRMKAQVKPSIKSTDFVLVLDDIRDPGNLGTIIRTAEWYGIRAIIASPETTDFYNPKVISATMGSFLRTNVFYTALPEFLSGVSMPVYGTFLKGENIHTMKFGKGGLIVIGNESKGISEPVQKFVTNRITIPRFGEAESLNASTATAIVLDNLRRSL